MRLFGGAIFDSSAKFVSRDLCFENGFFCEQSAGECMDISGCYVIPGLTDLHFHGCNGADLSDGTLDALRQMAAYELQLGVTQICPACMTLPKDSLLQLCRAAAAAAKAPRPGEAELVGINLEGPFLSAEKKGAQNGNWLRTPDIELLRELDQASNYLVRLVTVAPELPGAISFIQNCPDSLTVSIGHTAATYQEALTAFEAGARQVTHLFNAMVPSTHREPGVAGAAFDCPDVRVELICDGVHIHKSVVRAVFKLFGCHRVVLISDSMRAAGLSDGTYTLGGQPVTVSGSTATLSNGTLAGSVTDLMGCLRTAVSFGIPLADAVVSAAVNPAKILGIYDRLGSLDIGKEATFVVLGRSLAVRQVFQRGHPL